MRKPRTSVSYGSLKTRIAERIKATVEILERTGYESSRPSPREFYDYMTGETPTDDTITVCDVLDNYYLMIHEVVELSELKKVGTPINKDTVMKHLQRVYKAHYTAIERELDHALSRRDFDWLKVRIEHAKSWLEDDRLPPHLVSRCRALVKKYSGVLRMMKKQTDC